MGWDGFPRRSLLSSDYHNHRSLLYFSLRESEREISVTINEMIPIRKHNQLLITPMIRIRSVPSFTITLRRRWETSSSLPPITTTPTITTDDNHHSKTSKQKEKKNTSIPRKLQTQDNKSRHSGTFPNSQQSATQQTKQTKLRQLPQHVVVYQSRVRPAYQGRLSYLDPDPAWTSMHEAWQALNQSSHSSPSKPRYVTLSLCHSASLP